MKKFLSAAKNMLPALAVVIVLLVCAAMPELGVIPDRLTSEVEAEETDAADDSDTAGQAVGDYVDGTYVGSATGYGGLITVQVTVEDSQMTEIEVLDHSGETDSFYNRAVAVIDSILLAQTWEVDAISGATYSSNGIKNAVKNAVTGEETESETAAESGDDDALEEVEYEDPNGYIDGIYYGSATGFGGTITVAVTIEDGVITSIEIVSAPGETESYFSQALAVIDAILSAQTPNVDAISGATYSSNGIINAVKEALSQAVSSSSAAASSSSAGSSSSSDDSSASGSTVSDTSALPNYGYIDGTYTGSGIGYGGEVVLIVTIEGGQIVDIEVVSAEGETYAYWNQAIALLDLIIEAQTTDGIDAVSGATFSSNGILDAVADALAQAVPSDDGEDDSTGGADSSDGGSGEEGSTGSDDTGDETSSVVNYGYVDGTYTGTGTGYGGEIVLIVTIEGGLIVDIEVVSADGETYAYWMQAVTLIDLILETQTADGVDVVAGATYSSNGIISAIQDALEQAAASGEEEEAGSSDDDGSEDESGAGTGSDDTDDTEEDESSDILNYGYTDGTYTGTGTGYGGEIVLIVTIEGGLIVDIEVVSADGETYAYWMQAVTLIDIILETQTADGVDAVSGATYSSNGILDAVADALTQAASLQDEETDAADSGGSGDDTGSDDTDTGDADTDDEDDGDEDSGIDFSTLPNYGYIDGTYTGTGYGYGGDIVLTVTVEGGQIVSIEVVSADGETYAYWIQAVTLTDTIILAQTWEVDAVSGATFSSEGIMEAVQNALADAIAGDDESSEGNTDDSSSEDGSSDTETPDKDTEDDQSTDTGGDADNSTGDDNTSDDSTGDGGTTDDGTLNDDETSDDDSSGEPVTTVTTETYTVTGTATVYPDEYEDFNAYEITVAITLQKTVTTVTDGSTVTITTKTEIIDAEYSSDTDSTNLRYLSRAWTKMVDSLIAGEEADAVSGATCSSTGIQTAWDEALSGVTLGTVTETTETDEGDEEEEEEDTEPVTTEEVYTVQYSYTVTVTPDEDEDFDAYEAVITITVQTTVVTVTDGNSVAVTTTNEILDTAYESDTDSTNLRYLSRAWTKMTDSLTAGEEVDAISGATCSSNAILEAWEQFCSEVTLGTETTEYETASSYAMQSSAVIYANIPKPVDPEEECLTDFDDADVESDKEHDKKAGETARKEEDEE